MARVFVGMGDAMIFISLLRLVALWFPPARTAMITQITGVLGQLGRHRVAAAPLALALSAWGWTPSFATAAARRGRPRRRARPRRARLAVPTATTARSSRCGAVARALRLAWGEPGHPAGAVVALLGPVRRQRLRPALGLPVPRRPGRACRPGTASALLMLMTLTTVVASPVIGTFVTRWPYSRSTLVLWIVGAIMLGLGRRAAVAGPGAAARAGAAGRHHLDRRPGVDGRLRPGPHLQPAHPASAAPPGSSTSAASSRRCRRSP